MRLGLPTLLAMVMAGVLSGSPIAQEISPELSPTAHMPPEERFAFLLDQGRKNGQGLFFVDAILRGCNRLTMTVGRQVDGQFKGTRVRATRVGKGMLGGIDVPTPQLAPAGEYLIAALHCGAGNTTLNFTGPHAKFQVRAGEIVDVGTLRFVHKADSVTYANSSATRSVEKMSEEKAAELKAKLPRLMSKVVHRPMIITGPAEVKTQRRL